MINIKKCLTVCCILFSFSQLNAQYYTTDNNGGIHLNQQGASHFASLALKCIVQEFPNKTHHIQTDSSDVALPSDYHPAFYGCFDWHSSVHGHWMLVKLLKEYPQLPEADEIRKAIDKNITAKSIAKELEYFNLKYNKSFERMYGWAWLLKLAEELYTWNDPQAKEWSMYLKPLTELICERYIEFLPKQHYAIRTGIHPNTAFGLSFALDYATTTKHTALEQSVKKHSLLYYANDKNCPLNWEPSGADFLSPCLIEAELMSKVLPLTDYQKWLKEFLPQLYSTSSKQIQPILVSDRTDLQLVHLDGLNLSRAWCLLSISKKMEKKDQNRIKQLAISHLETTIPQIADGDYAGEHWLASFAVYALMVK